MRIPISEVVQRIAAIAKIAILGSGKRVALRDGELVCIVNSDSWVLTGESGQIWPLGPTHLPQAADRILRLTRRKRR